MSGAASGIKLNIDTPEQVQLEYSVAGIGSRFVAALLDLLILTGVFLVEALLLVFVGAAVEKTTGAAGVLDQAGKWFVAFIVFINFAIFWGYFSLFEALWNGQTPGKRAMKLRVIKNSGRQITLFEALARNLIRVVDYLPSMYLVGVITMLCNQRNKRLGDLAAGTLVVHERMDEQSMMYQTSTTLVAPVSFATEPLGGQAEGSIAPWGQRVTAMFPADAVAKLNAQDLVVVETFFARMLDLPMETRAGIAQRMASQMAAKMRVELPDGNPERALEAMAYQLRGSGRG